MAELKSKEEYCLRYEDQLLALTLEHFAAANQAMFFSYTIAAITYLVVNDLTSLLFLVSVGGDKDKWKEAKEPIAIYAPVLIAITLVYCSYLTYMIRKALDRFNKNAESLAAVNPVSRPITRGSIRLRRAGLVGFLLYGTRQLVKFFSKRGAQEGWWRRPLALAGLVATLLCLLITYGLPVVVVFCTYSSAKVKAPWAWPILLLSVSTVLLSLVLGQLVIRHADSYIRSSNAGNGASVYGWVRGLFSWLNGLVPKDDD